MTQRKLTPIEDVGFVVAVESTGDRGMWAGTTNGLLRFSTASDLWKRQGSAGPGVRTLYRDAQGTLWIGTNESLWRFERGNAGSRASPTVAAGIDHGHHIVGRRLAYGSATTTGLLRWDGSQLPG